MDASQSAKLRDKLITEVAAITSAEGAATWAKQALAAKNSLTAGDANLVEFAFEGKLSDISSSDPESRGKESTRTTAIDGAENAGLAEGVRPDGGIDKSTLTIPAPRRYRNREHLRFVMQQACLICGRKPSDPHHLRYMQPRALGRKASDEFAVPLCRVHHRAAHCAGDERAWWKAFGINPTQIARKLWKHTRVEEGQMPSDAPMQTPDAGVALKSESTGGAGRDLG
jgi:hypothetical protein